MNTSSHSTAKDLYRWLSKLPHDRARLVYLSAVPLWLDSDMLIALYGSRNQASIALQILEEHLLVTSVSRKRVVIRPEERQYLIRAGWDGELPDYIDVNSRLAIYCLEQLTQASDPSKQFRWARAALYHEIASQQSIGWQRLTQLYEDAEKRGLSGAALQVLEPLRELRPLLTDDDRAALVYYRARAALLAGELRKAECLFRAVIARGSPITVVAVAHRSLGQVLAGSQHWSEALKQFRQSEVILRRNPSRDPLSLALTQLGIGNMYQEMAEFSGSIVRTTPPSLGSWFVAWVRALLRLPVQLYRWAGHSIQRLPFIDVGFNYQNWIAARLMLAAEAAYRSTIRVMAGNASPQELYEARLGLARIYTKLDMERRAEHLLNVLAQWSYVNESEYRQAQVNFCRAELAEAQQKNTLAEELLQQVIEIFSTYQQQHGLATAYHRLANLIVLRGDIQTGLAAYQKSAALFELTGQSLFQTVVLNRISQLSDDALTKNQREYLAAFPGDLGRLYRYLAYFGMGILFFLTTLLAFFSLVAVFRTEASIMQGLLDITTMALMITWPLVSIWLIQIIYLGLGLLISFLLPIGTLERDPPLRILLNDQELSIRGGKNHEDSNSPWDAIVSIQTVDYQLRSRPIKLFSYLDVLSQKKRWRIPALTTGYVNLCEDLKRHVAPSKLKALSFMLIAHPLNYLAGLLVFPIGIAFQIAADLGAAQAVNSSQFTPTLLSGILLGAFITGLLLFPLFTFWRLVIHQWQLWRNTPLSYPHPRPSVLTHLFAILWTFLTFLYLRYIYIFFLA